MRFNANGIILNLLLPIGEKCSNESEITSTPLRAVKKVLGLDGESGNNLFFFEDAKNAAWSIGAYRTFNAGIRRWL
jgi:hypothetical protein